MKKKLILILFLFSFYLNSHSGIVYGQTVDPETKILNEAYKNITSGDLMIAEEALIGLISQENYNPKAELYLGLIYQKQGILDKALVQYFKAYHFDKKNPMVNYNLGLIFQEMKNNNKALSHYLNVLEETDSIPNVYYNIAKIYQEIEGKNEGAIDFYNKYLSFYPEDVSALNNLAVIFINNCDYEKATSILKNTLDIDPTYPPARYNLALIYLMTNNLKMLNKEFKLLEKISPDHAKVLETQVENYNVEKKE